jgi:6-phosphogluconolactonase
MNTSAQALQQFAYIGSRTTRERNARGEGITVLRYNANEATFEKIQVLSDWINPSFLIRNAHGDRLYTVHGDQDMVSAFIIDHESGMLAHLNTMPCNGRNPVHLAITPDGANLVVSNHVTGTLALMGLGAQGQLEAVHQSIALEGKPGPHRIEQPFSKPHFNPFDPSGRFVLVPDKGLDRVFVFAYRDGKLRPARVPHLDTREGSGPRHIVFHPQQPWVYVINELDSTVLNCTFDAASGALAPRQVISALPEHFTGNSRASEIAIDGLGRWLFASNRGADSIAVFSIDLTTGWLHLNQVYASGGTTPRYFQLSPDEKFLFVLNEDSDSIITFAFDASSGTLSQQKSAFQCGSPVSLVFRSAF